MIKKSLCFFLLALMPTFILANNTLTPMMGFGQNLEPNNNSIKDLQEGFEYLRNHIGGDSLLIEANLYEFGSIDGNIAPDPQRALKIYIKLYGQGNPYAAYKLGMLAWLIKKDPKAVDKSLVDILKSARGLDPLVYFQEAVKMDSNYRYKDIVSGVRKILGIYVFIELKDYKKTIEIMNNPDIESSSIAQLYSAFAYYELKNKEMANLFLNKACHNKDKGDEVNMFCSSSKVLDRQKIGE